MKRGEDERERKQKGGRKHRKERFITSASAPHTLTPQCMLGHGGWTHAVDHYVHDGLGHEVADGLVDDADVGIHQVADRLHLPL